MCICASTAARIPANVDYNENRDLYSPIPNEIVPIRPILVYPKKSRTYQGRNLLQDNDIIYVKLLDRKNYRPKKYQLLESVNSRELQTKDIFYVKAKVNGQFSTNRLKVYRMPEFYAISVYKKPDSTQWN